MLFTNLLFIAMASLAIAKPVTTVSILAKLSSANFKRIYSAATEGHLEECLDQVSLATTWLQRKRQEYDSKKDSRTDQVHQPTIEDLAEEPTDAELAGKLSRAIKRVAGDIRNAHDSGRRQYSYEEWVEFTLRIRFTAKTGKEREVGLDR
ncbi:hypothetical protein AC578_6999 [Pseudocercospora eumusae]|uniref:Uncharacterized protein n=1 Tax=Pseudocercospora eumusae TaxID=321146 RepID=A0A139GTP6_9PEZI|nr:hypothetical protein AC578_6999 [Pseudocercospora eumusae]